MRIPRVAVLAAAVVLCMVAAAVAWGSDGAWRAAMDAARAAGERGGATEAIPAYEKAMAEADAAFGPGDPRTLHTLATLASAQAAAGRLEDAERSYRRAVEAADTGSARHAPALPSALVALGSFLARAGRTDEAAALLGRALSLQELSAGPTSPALAPALLALASLHDRAEDWARSELVWGRLLAIGRARMAEDDARLLPVLDGYARALRGQGCDEEARSVEERAGALRAATAPGLQPPSPSGLPSPAAPDDLEAAMRPYVEEARRTYPEVRERFQRGLPRSRRLLVTTRLSDASGRTALVYLSVERIANRFIEGTIASVPGALAGIQVGERRKIAEDDVLDWTILSRDGTREGDRVGQFLRSLGPPPP